VVEVRAVAAPVPPEVRAAAHLAAAGRLPEAVAAYQSLLARNPDQPDCWYELGFLQRRLRRFDAALDSYAQALRRGVQRPEEVHLNRGVIFADCLHQPAAAEQELRLALAANPGYLPALQNLANLHEDLGREREALEAYERILALDPRAFTALARYAQLLPVSADDSLVGQLRAALSGRGTSAADRASLGFALAHRLDALGEYSAAFAAAEAANRESRASAGSTAHYDREAHERFIDALIAAFPEPRAPALPPGGAGTPGRAEAPDPRPIFVCGMFRSGSTLTERLLAGHPEVRAGGELDLLPYLVQTALTPFPARMAAQSDAALRSLAARYLQELQQLFPGARYVTDKRPDNFLLIGLIKTLFPQARIVHTTREALDTCLSVFFLHLDPRLSWALELLDIGHYLRQYQRLMRHWRSLYGADIMDFSYEQLVSEPRPSVERLLAFCGLEWNEGCLEFARSEGAVKTASVWQVREPLYQRSCGRARHYARELSPLAAYLAGSEPHG
jgi:cytochrome c-type biogenesis protein CcmH/NrfG